VRPRHPITMLLAVSLALAGCGGAPTPPATPLPAVAEYKYNELPAECFPGYRHLVEEFARSMVNQIDQLNEGHVISNIDSRPIRNTLPPGKEADRTICSAMFLPSDLPPPGNPRQRTVRIELEIYRNYWPALGTTEQQVQSLYRREMSKLPPEIQLHELPLGEEGASWFDTRIPMGKARVRDGNLWVEVTADGTDIGPDGQDRSIPAAEAEAAAVKLAAAALASVQR
jgi:hypothetical protein